MDDHDLRRYTEELARAHCAWAKAVPNGSDEQIKAAVEDVGEARRALYMKMAKLDHLLGHPWRVGMPGNCECHTWVDGLRTIPSAPTNAEPAPLASDANPAS